MRYCVAPFSRVALLTVISAAAAAFLSAIPDICAAQNPTAQPRRFEVRIENARLASPLKALQVARGDSVEIAWSADRRTVLHLHGYDIEVTVDPDETKVMAFQARATGRFPIE